MTVVILVVLTSACQGNPVATKTAPPGATEPVFAAGNTSLFYDDFEAYGTTADLTTGPTAKYYLRNGIVTLVTTTGGDFAGGAKYVRFDYSAAGAYANEIYTTQQSSPILDTASVVVLTYGFRNTGTWYAGKELIIRNGAGDQRFVLISFGDLIQPQSLQNCWYTSTYPYNPLTSLVPPRGTTPTWSRDGLESVGGPTPVFMGGTMGYPAAQLSTKNNGNWHRFTYRFTKERAGAGTGRVEGWYDGVKFMEYVGDDAARCEHGQVWTWSAANTVWDGDLYFVGTTSGGDPWPGGAVVYMDGVRLWVP